MTRRLLLVFLSAVLGAFPGACGRGGCGNPSAQDPAEKPSHATQTPSNEVAGDWPQFRGNPSLTGTTTGTFPKKLRLAWSYDAGAGVESSAAIVGDTAFFGSNDGFLHAVDTGSGKARWKFKAEGALKASPAVQNGVVFVGDDQGNFLAVDAARAKAVWTFKAGAEILSSANLTDGLVLFGSYDNVVYALQARNGQLQWKFESEGRVHGTLAVHGEHAFVAGCDGQLRVIRIRDGTEVRKIDLGSYSGASPAVSDDLAVVGTMGNKVVGAQWLKGERLWEYEAQQDPLPYLSSAAVAEGIAVVGGRDRRVHGLDTLTGRPLWVLETKGKVDSSPIIVGQDVFVGSSDGNLYRVDLKSGTETWRFDAGSPVSASPAAGRGRLIVGTEGGTVYAFGPDDPKPQ